MKILVVGVGVHRSVIATELVRSPEVSEVMLGKGEIKTLGVIPPECLESEVIERFIAELAEKGIIIHERVERRLA